MSSISMISHIYDSTSYGGSRNYAKSDGTKCDLRQELL